MLGGEKTPVVTFAVRSLGKFQTGEVEGAKKGDKGVEVAPFEGVLTLDDRKVKVQGRAIFRYGYPKGSETPDSAVVECACTVNGADLGLKNIAGPIQVRAGATAYIDARK